MSLITTAKKIIGMRTLATACGFKNHRTIGQWEENGLPMSDLTGETNYSAIIEEMSAGKVTRYDLLCSRLADMTPGIIYKLPTNIFRADPDQARNIFPAEHIASTAAAILADGQETPIKAKYQPAGDQPPMLITHGECRWRAISEKTDLETIDCLLDINDDSATDRKFRQAADNNGRPLSHWDWVTLFTTMHDTHKMTDAAIEAALKKRGLNRFSRSKIANLRRLITLPNALQQMIATEWLTPSHGKYLLQVKHDGVMATIIDELTYLKNRPEPAPSITNLLIQIRDIYIITPTIKRIMTSGNGGSIIRGLTDFNPDETCDCDSIIRLTQSDGLTDLFCTDLACWQKNQNSVTEDPPPAKTKNDEHHEQTTPSTQDKIEDQTPPTQTTTPPNRPPKITHSPQRMRRTVNITVGKYTLTDFDENSLWLAHENGEGMKISNDDLMHILDKHFREHF